MSAARPSHAERLLIAGHVFEPGGAGGLQIALSDLAAALTARGWTVDLAITPDALGFSPSGRRKNHMKGFGARRFASMPRFRFLPPDARTLVQHLLLDGGVAHVQSDLIRALDVRLRAHHDAVIAVVSRAAPGLARFITERHPNVLILSLNGLSSELRLSRWLKLARLNKRLVARGRLHPAIYRAVDPARIRMAVFASETWREDAVRAGLPASVARTIYFGLPHVPPLEDLNPARNRLLWVGRLSPEKGLHHFLEALARLRRARPVVLTAVCGPGPEGYRQSIVNRVRDLGLGESVRLLPWIPRDELTTIYRSHDALLFDSPFSEPAALVLLEAFAAGLPVVGRRPARQGGLLQPDMTCVCFPSTNDREIAEAVERMLGDEALRQQIRRRAYALVQQRFSLDAMGDAYDAALRTLIGGARGDNRGERAHRV